MATDETRAEASNPGTSPARLQELTSDAELWPLIAANPNAYDSLLTWLGENGGADVQAAIASRGAGAEPTSVLPSGPYEQAGPPLTPPPGGSALPPPGGGSFPPPGGATPPPAGFPAPGGPQGGSGDSKKGLWITLAVLVFLLVASGIGVGVWALTKGDDSDSDSDRNDSSDTDPTDDPSDDTDEDSDRDSDRDNDDDSGSSDFCDVIDDVDTAAFDVYLYFPGLDEPDDLADSVSVLEDNIDDAPSDVADALQVLIDYADEVADLEDSTEIPTDSKDEAEDAYDIVFEYYLDC